MAFSDHQGKHNINLSQRKNVIMELNINDVILAQNKLLTQAVDDLKK